MYFDWTYVIYVLPALLLSLLASARVKSVYSKYSRKYSSRGITGEEAARSVLNANGVRGVRIEHINGEMTDHYDPRTNTIRLSDGVFSSSSCAAIGIAAHEAGHAVQHSEEYTPLKLRNAIIPVTNIGSRLSTPLVIVGILLSYYSERLIFLAYAGIICFGACVVFQLLTLPTEFNASRRALGAIREQNLLYGEEYDGAKAVLSAAAMTYVAAMAVALMQLLRLLVIVKRNDRRR